MLPFAEQLKKLRAEKQFSQEFLAEQLYISRQAISKWENREASPDLENVVKLAEIFEVSLDELVLAKKQSEVTKTDFDHFLYNPNTGEYEKHRSQKISNFYEFATRFWPLLLIIFWGLSYLIYSIIKLFV